jgi:SnoaL-like protein
MAEISDNIMKQIRRKVDAKEHRAIRQLWISHSVAEDARDIPGLMATLTEDCVYTIVDQNFHWYGKEGATRFYTELLTAIPDVHFDLQNIIIGPQGVYEEAHAHGAYQHQWLDLPEPKSQQHIDFDVIIVFPWNPDKQLFSGERIYFFNVRLTNPSD